MTPLDRASSIAAPRRVAGATPPEAGARVAAMAQLACLLEVSAPKPGNVSPGRHFADTRYEHFLASAAALGAPLAGVGTRPLGATIRLAIEATSRFTPANTNLGIVLLLAPLARAALAIEPAGIPPNQARDQAGGRLQGRVPDRGTFEELQAGVGNVLAATTVEDARDVYAAIRLASPGGLGRADEQDVAEEPTGTLLEVMRLAGGRDGIASEYATGFGTTFGTGVPALSRARADGLSWDDAIVETFLTLLAAGPDTHIARRGGLVLAEAVSDRARTVLAAGGIRSAGGVEALSAMDASLRDAANTANPGTTADLTAAALFVFLVCGGWDVAGRSL
jgi:triphosphoribosyl-dephospho-CoA synthase